VAIESTHAPGCSLTDHDGTSVGLPADTPSNDGLCTKTGSTGGFGEVAQFGDHRGGRGIRAACRLDPEPLRGSEIGDGVDSVAIAGRTRLPRKG
jgi:hypothetical protein